VDRGMARPWKLDAATLEANAAIGCSIPAPELHISTVSAAEAILLHCHT